jgi:hypothetical protein
MITAPRAEPYYPRDDQPLVAFRMTRPEMQARFGPAHRVMGPQDNEPGPCEYWAYRLSDSLSVLITFHLQSPGGSSGDVTATEPDVDRIIELLGISDVVIWRLDSDCSELFTKRYPDWSH